MKTETTYLTPEPFVTLQHALAEWKHLVKQAMTSIAENDLPRLEQSLWQQQMFSAALQKLLPASRPAELPEQIRARLLDTAKEVLLLNQSYAELLQQARQTGDVLYQLCVKYAEAEAFSTDSACLHPVEV